MAKDKFLESLNDELGLEFVLRRNDKDVKC